VSSQEVHYYWIPEFMEEWVRDQLSKLNNRAMKLDCLPINISKTDKVEYRKVFVDDGRTTWNTYKFIEIALCGEPPKLRGWKFVGVVQHMEVNGETANILRLLESETVPEGFHYVENKCDHCMFIRNRNDTYLVRKDDQVLQVGSSCLKDFTGHKNPHTIALIAEDFLSFLRNLENSEDYLENLGNFHNYPSYYQIEDFLYFVVASINQYGFISRKMIQNGDTGGMPTSEIAWNGMTETPAKRNVTLQSLKAYDSTTIANALNWIRSEATVDSSNDYMWNLYVACSQTHISNREAGLVASLIPTYQRYVEKIEKQQLENEGKIGGYVGEIGKRTNLGKLSLITVIVTEGFYGTTFIHKFSDEDGNIIVWMTGKDLRDELADGWIVENAVASVKKHDEFRGEKQTTITRMKWN